MKAIKLNKPAPLIRACVTEDRAYCLATGGSDNLPKAIDNTVNGVIAKIKSDVYGFRIDTDDGRIAGFALLRIGDSRAVIDTFIRPNLRSQENEFIVTVNTTVNSFLRPIG